MKSSTKYLKILANYLLFAASIFLVFYIVPKFIVFFMPFVVAAIIALIAGPLVKFLEKKIRIKRKAGTAIVIILTIALVVFCIYMLISVIVSELSGFTESLPGIWKSVNATFRGLNDTYSVYLNKMPESVREWFFSVGDGISESLSDWVSGLGEKTASAASNMLKNIPLTVVSVVMAILASYLFVAEKDYILKNFNKFVGPGIRRRWDLVWTTLKTAVGGYFKAQFKIEIFVYAVLFIGLLILRIKYAFLIALLIAFLDLLPFFGAGVIMWPWALIAALQNNYEMAVGIMIVWAVGQIVRQLIQPKMVGDSVGIEPIPTLLFLYIGFRLGGAIGLIISIPVGMIIINLYKAGLYSNLVYSTRILIKDLSVFRKFTNEELESEGISRDEIDIDEVAEDD